MPLWQPPETGDTASGTADSGPTSSAGDTRSPDDIPPTDDAGPEPDSDKPHSDKPDSNEPHSDKPDSDEPDSTDAVGIETGRTAPVVPVLSMASSVPPALQSLSAPTSAPTTSAPVSLSSVPTSSALGLLTLFGLPLLSGGNSPAPGNPIGWALLWIVRRHQEHWHNQAPVAAPTVTTSDPDTGVVTGDLNATDHEGNPITYQVTSGPTAGDVVVDADGTFVYTPGPDLIDTGGTDTFTVTLSDDTGPHHHHVAIPFWLGSTGHTSTTTVTVVIDPVHVNSAPTLAVGATSAPDPRTGAVTGTITATDPDGDVLTYTVNGSTSTTNTFTTDRGTVTLNGDGTYTFTPVPEARWNASFYNATEAETLTFAVDDGQGGTDSTSVTVGIAGYSAPGDPVGTGQVSADGTIYLTSTDGTDTYVTIIDPATHSAHTLVQEGTANGPVLFSPSGSWYQLTAGTDGPIVSQGNAGGAINHWQVWTAGDTLVGDPAFDAAGNAYLTSWEAGSAVYVTVLHTDGTSTRHDLGVGTPVGGVVVGPGGSAYQTLITPGGNPLIGATYVLLVSGTEPVSAGTISGKATGPVQFNSGGAFQVTYDQVADQSTVTDLSVPVGNAGHAVTVSGQPYGTLQFGDATNAVYLVTTTANANTKVHQYLRHTDTVRTTNLQGMPVGDAVTDPTSTPGQGERIFVTTQFGTDTLVHSVDSDGAHTSVTIAGTAYGAPQLSSRAGGDEDGLLYQTVTTAGGDRRVYILHRDPLSLGRDIKGGPPTFHGDGMYLISSTGTPESGTTYLTSITPTEYVANGSFGITNLPGAVPQSAPGSEEPELVVISDGSYYPTIYVTLISRDPNTGAYTTRIGIHREFLRDVYTIPGNHLGSVQLLPDGTMIQTVFSDGVTRYIIVKGERI